MSRGNVKKLTIVSAKLGVKILTVNPQRPGGSVNNLTPDQNLQLFIGYLGANKKIGRNMRPILELFRRYIRVVVTRPDRKYCTTSYGKPAHIDKSPI